MYLLKKVLFASTFSFCCGAVLAQPFPERALRLIVPFSAGGITDFAARQVAKDLGDVLGQSIVVENRAGAGGVIGAKEAISAPADGYTLFMGTVGTQIVNTLLFKQLPYDPDKQFAPIGLATNTPSILAVTGGLPAKSLDEFIAYSRARPGVLNYAAAGTLHLGMETLKAAYNLDIVKVPYKGSGESMAALVGGLVQVGMDGGPVIAPHLKSGKIRALAVMSDQPLSMMPDVPTTTQLGVPDLKAGNWTGLYVRSGTPPERIEILNTALQKVLASPSMKSRLAEFGTQLYTGTLSEYQSHIEADKIKVKKLVELSGLQPQ